ncbi:DUF1697 domain-containing protein [Lutibacter maritimus]|uniref:Uncharacterized conserved protein, DUF1697 family n=1 Tax=Lutibacter maritimus TaxID=593133 RepID=A0A1I6NP80_9FLAO|nr:DUF1697 domain-containing protein [Lutibacter maritimus]SFS29688.1 Uncharacterized conserved protein, DUF1697 family [Lutibacter maritimus]
MNTYIALLRGINVSGHNKIKMVDLQQLFINNGYTNVTTYIQSGNVIFSSDELNTSKIEHTIINEIKKQFSYAIKVLVLKKSELTAIYNFNAFKNITELDFKNVCVTILKENPAEEGIEKVKSLAAPDEKIIFKERNVYIYCPNGFGRTKLSNTNIEAKLKVYATSRNWNTITKLVELSNI